MGRWDTIAPYSPEIQYDTVHTGYPPVLVPPTSAYLRRGGHAATLNTTSKILNYDALSGSAKCPSHQDKLEVIQNKAWRIATKCI